MAKDKLFITAIEANFECEMQEYQNTRVVSEVSSSVTIEFQEEYYNDYFQREILNRYKGAFAMQAFYKFDSAHYDMNRTRFIIDDLKKAS